MEDVNESLYVDDYVSGGDEKLEICERKQKLQERFQAGGFTIRKWYTNEESIARKISDEPSNEQRKVLGTIWDPGEDLLKINLAVPESQKPTTKRQLLTSLSAIYDPLGVAGPLVMKARVLFQKLCSHGKGWDDILSEEEEKIYQKWLSEMQRIRYLSFPRMVGAIPRGDYDLSLHTFCDASGVGYCANVYVVISTIRAIQSRLLTA